MPTRREVLLGLIAAPLAASHASPVAEFNSEPDIRPEPHCLSQESAQGFGLLLKKKTGARQNIIILPASRDLSDRSASELLRKVLAGAWLIYESGLCFSSSQTSLRQCRLLREIFGLDVAPPLSISGLAPKTFYVQYLWPLEKLVRSFHAITTVRCAPEETIAEFQGMPVCARRFLGNGGVVYLGSMLGVGLFAEEREAHRIGNAMLAGLRQGARNDSNF